MGMSASQVNEVFLLSRSNAIGARLMQLSNDKRALTRDMQKVSQEYQQALSSKVLKWSDNSGVSYSDLSYNNLMRPSEMNKNTPYLLTDNQGRVVIDSKYQKYAEMISPDGSAKGNYEANRTQILSELTGIDASKINSMSSNEAAVIEAKEKMDGLVEPSRSKFEKSTPANQLLEKMSSNGIRFKKSATWSQAYRNADSIDLGNNVAAAAAIKSILTNIGNTLGPYFMEQESAFKQACQDKITEYTGLVNTGQDFSNGAGAIRGKNNDYNLDVVALIEELFSAAGVESCQGNGYDNQPQYTWYDINSSDYQQYQKDHAQWETNYKSAEDAYNNAVGADNQLLTAEEESKIQFYDVIFSSIAEKGWTCNNQVNDTDYLNQMLQNNLYMITTVERTSEYDTKKDKFSWLNEYSTDIASNCDNIFAVSDSDARNQALAEYEYKKSIINEKETRIDTRMQDLQTEQAAIKQMIESVAKVKSDNIERTMSVMG